MANEKKKTPASQSGSATPHHQTQARAPAATERTAGAMKSRKFNPRKKAPAARSRLWGSGKCGGAAGDGDAPDALQATPFATATARKIRARPLCPGTSLVWGGSPWNRAGAVLPPLRAAARKQPPDLQRGEDPFSYFLFGVCGRCSKFCSLPISNIPFFRFPPPHGVWECASHFCFQNRTLVPPRWGKCVE
ncbi:hypothetical protein LSM04_009401 [Trypanosoma melophagium]|uniref:uncharacterized protein n=1 Tax=Trypanosoma melophagium TaxID=715481 RepID=UPI003519DED4|nr:hypothetical protein LSM04_009401 [Trypanosoma melophagium]